MARHRGALPLHHLIEQRAPRRACVTGLRYLAGTGVCGRACRAAGYPLSHCQDCRENRVSRTDVGGAQVLVQR